MAQLRAIRLGLPVANVWLVPDASGGPILVDTGFPLLWPLIEAGLRLHGVSPSSLRAVILTHRHLDHAGNARRLAETHGVPVYAHHADAAILTGAVPRPPMETEPTIAGAMALLERHLPPSLDEVHPLDAGQVVHGLEVIPLPGHTVGSIGLLHHASGSLFSGDALINAIPPLAYETALSLPFPLYCDDYLQALDTLRRLVADPLPVTTLFAGHGPPYRGDFVVPLAELLASVQE